MTPSLYSHLHLTHLAQRICIVIESSWDIL
jgi:hypothetical protein